jgi:tyrosyl-tRNA synthetase
VAHLLSEDQKKLFLGVVKILPDGGLEAKLKEHRPLRIKLGADPTSSNLHLGHAVVLKKLKQFQDLGHEVIFLIGDFTARIGDPTGKSKTRPPLDVTEIAKNMQTYFDQIGRVLDRSKISVRYNSEWLASLTLQDMIKLCSSMTVAQLIEREDFAKRLAENQAIGLHELLYPILQGYDSVALKADVEVGGTDQTFNMLCGRQLQEHFGQNPQIVITMPLLEGLDGVQKMSKSLGNAVGLTEPASQAYGKMMSISDDMMWKYYTLLLDYSPEQIAALQKDIADGVKHPMDLKKKMAHDVIEQFWGPVDAESAQEQFEAVFQKRDFSAAQQVTLPEGTQNPLWIVDLLKQLDAVKTSSEARRLIESSAILVDETTITDFKAQIVWKPGTTIKVGKHRIYCIA